MTMRKTYEGRIHRHHHHHHHRRLAGEEPRRHRHHVRHHTHRRLSAWNVFVKHHAGRGITLRRLGEMYRQHTGKAKTRTTHHKRALSW